MNTVDCLYNAPIRINAIIRITSTSELNLHNFICERMTSTHCDNCDTEWVHLLCTMYPYCIALRYLMYSYFFIFMLCKAEKPSYLTRQVPLCHQIMSAFLSHFSLSLAFWMKSVFSSSLYLFFYVPDLHQLDELYRQPNVTSGRSALYEPVHLQRPTETPWPLFHR